MRLPRVKPEHAPHRLGDGTVRLGGALFGIASEIVDADGWAWTALGLMDGTRAPAEIAAELRARHPVLTCEEAEDIVATLVSSGHVEDAAPEPCPELTEREKERHSRTRDYFRWVDLTPRDHGWEPQVRIKNARVVVLGLGGTGSHVAWTLAAAGVGRLHLVDPDVVELSNLNRQILYTEPDVGRLKAEVALDRLRQVNSEIGITAEAAAVDGPARLARLIDGFDVLALCADRPRGPSGIQSWANRVCAEAGIPWVSGGYNGPLVSVGVFGPGGPCYECVRAGIPPCPGADYAWPGVTGASAGLSGHLVAHDVLALVSGVMSTPPGYFHGVMLLDPDGHVYARHPSRPGCDICS
ncbi:HesA/MoeB/ThiF family protein [Nonomuraea roseoviolacea]|uniref:Molybdopterin/thiamine biosynthesis adenylyltransferase n=1 Tax=Nonomuraea roseoviolacea subsp. carminata TaxID=160689 RepID=A0ABT1JZQ3_9ACTN|nr:HesA/MoeB/ThiF family protein [Nonomuraea roseoviolacea]MCP2346731.1 molybdopterin/thiamine biosynthesis adenylyltransferase [Nonomuraea roseoviolacea subsp. carminata]